MGGVAEGIFSSVTFLAYALGMGAVMVKLEAVTGIPYTLLMTICGMLLCFSTMNWPLKSTYFDQENGFDTLTSQSMLIVFIPPLVFQSAMKVHYFIFKKARWQILVLASGVLVVSTLLSSALLSLVFKKDFTFYHALLLGSIISATDPVAVVALLENLGASPILGTIIEGESLLNDGAAMVLYTAFREQCFRGAPLSAGEYALTLLRMTTMSFIIGWGMGWLISVLVYNNRNSMIKLSYITVSGCFIGLLVSSIKIYGTSFGVPGPLASEILTCVITGLHIAGVSKLFAAHTWKGVENLWDFIANALNTVLFCSLGLIIADDFENVLFADTWGSYYKVWEFFLYQLLVYLGINIIRFISIFLFFPVMKKWGYPISIQEVLFMSFGGLRGAIGIALGLSIALEPDQNVFPPRVKLIFEHTTAMMAFLTMLINGYCSKFVLTKLGLLEKEHDLFSSVTDEVSEDLYLRRVFLIIASHKKNRSENPAFRYCDWDKVKTNLIDVRADRHDDIVRDNSSRHTHLMYDAITHTIDNTDNAKLEVDPADEVEEFLLVGRAVYLEQAQRMYQQRLLTHLDSLGHGDEIRPEVYYFLTSCEEYKLDHLDSCSFLLLTNMLRNRTKLTYPTCRVRLFARLMTPSLASSDVVFECLVVFTMIHKHVQHAVQRRLDKAVERAKNRSTGKVRRRPSLRNASWTPVESEEADIGNVELVLQSLIDENKRAIELANEALAQMSTVKRGLVVKSYSTAMTYYYIRARIVAMVDHLKESGELSERVADRIEHDLKPIPRGTFYEQEREFDVPRVCKMLCKKQRRVVPYFAFDELKFRKTKRSSFTNPIKSLQVVSVGENPLNTHLLKPRQFDKLN